MRRNHPICEQVEGDVVVPAWVPWASQEVSLGACQMPESYRMHVFDLSAWRQQLGPGSPDGHVEQEEGSDQPPPEGSSPPADEARPQQDDPNTPDPETPSDSMQE